MKVLDLTISIGSGRESSDSQRLHLLRWDGMSCHDFEFLNALLKFVL